MLYDPDIVLIKEKPFTTMSIPTPGGKGSGLSGTGGVT
jgi:hypothetical protein